MAHGIFTVVHGLSCCGLWAQLPPGRWDLSSPTRDQTPIPSIAGWILDHQGSPRPVLFNHTAALRWVSNDNKDLAGDKIIC